MKLLSEHINTKAEFLNKFGGVFEKSPWIAEKVWEKQSTSLEYTLESIHEKMVKVFQSATDAKKLEVLRSHPDLAGKLMMNNELTVESTLEQKSAGLNNLEPKEQQLFYSLNKTYINKNKFPFIIAAKGLTSKTILEIFKNRATNTTEIEFKEACLQVNKIAYLRLIDIFK